MIAVQRAVGLCICRALLCIVLWGGAFFVYQAVESCIHRVLLCIVLWGCAVIMHAVQCTAGLRIKSPIAVHSSHIADHYAVESCIHRAPQVAVESFCTR